ncbi:MAG: ABC transporter ATP-binding protein [Syntrophobacteraceae bacterium]
MPLLELDHVSKSFGGLMAVSEVSFKVHEGEIVGLIGPNGAGKTTLFNLISGIYRPESGAVTFEGRDITGLPSYKRSRIGIGRTFQVVRPFEMTVVENIMVPVLTHTKNLHRAEAKAREVMEMMGLTHLADVLPGSLTLAQRKRIEVARALATYPKLLLLDEVLAGLNPTEVAENLPLIRRLRDNGLTILFIEHLMDAVMAVSERVLVMDLGLLICSGTPDQVTSDACVIKAYLGEEVSDADN